MLLPALQSGLVAPIGAGQMFPYLRRTRGSAAFDPSTITGLKLWLKADTGLYDATSGGSAVTADAASVARWEDQSGNANHVTQGTSGSRPVLKTSILNGRSVIRFDGVDDVMVGGNNVIGSSFSIFAAFVLRAAPSDYRPVLIGAPTNNSYRMVVKTSASNWGTYSSGDKSASSALSSGSAYLLAQIYANGGTGDFRKNGAGDGTWTAAPQGSSGVADQLGAEAGASRFLQFDLAELVAYNAAVTTTDRDNVEAYLNGRYAIY